MTALTQEQVLAHIQKTLSSEIDFLQRQAALRNLSFDPVDMAEFENEVRKQLINILLDCAGVPH